MKPNLFKFATKELSQDGFLAWLLQWADPTNTYMTVARVERQTWLGADDDLVDMDSVIARLNRYESWLVGLIEAQQSPIATI